MPAFTNLTTCINHQAATIIASASTPAINTTGGGFGWSTTLWVAFGAIIAAVITRQIKISEFRQAWINGLREDIAEFMSKADEWVDLYLDFNHEFDQAKKANIAKRLDKIKYGSYKIFRRIELRFKPDDKEANNLLANLITLLDPSKLPETGAKAKWHSMAEDVVVQARHILKKEWEVTKHPYRMDEP